MAFLRKNKRAAAIEDKAVSLEALINQDECTEEQAKSIPTVSACLDLITELVANLPIKLYKKTEKGLEEVVEDNRIKLLNIESNDIINCFDMKSNLISDYLLLGDGHIYINRNFNDIKSLNYVESRQVTAYSGIDPIFKNVVIIVQGKNYEYYDFINLARKSNNGIKASGILQRNNLMLSVAYNYLKFEKNNVKNTGIKKGVIESESKLSDGAITSLKAAWKNLFSSDNTENCIILNKGLSYKDLQQTSVEMQLVESKKVNAEEIAKLFKVPLSVLNGTATEDQYNNFIKDTIIPIISKLESALNQSLLLESEKGSYFFEIDDKNLLKGDIEKRYKAYESANKAGWITKNEIRTKENLEEIEGLDIVTMSLGETIYDTETKTYYVANTNSKVDLKKVGDEENEDRN